MFFPNLSVASVLVNSSPASCCGPAQSAQSRDMAQFVSDPNFVAAHFTPAATNYRLHEGKLVTFSVDGAPVAHGYYVAPKAGSHSAIVMFHEWWGLNTNIEEEAEKLHDATGYAVLVPDMYDGKVTDDPKVAGQLMGGFNVTRGLQIAGSAVVALTEGTLGFKPKTIGTVGYCFGGGWSEREAVLGGPHVQACVVYYGMPDDRPQSIKRLRAPVLFFYGEQDPWINAKVVTSFAEKVRAAKKSIEVHGYDAPHAFANPSNPKYSPTARADSMKRELAFFKTHLK